MALSVVLDIGPGALCVVDLLLTAAIATTFLRAGAFVFINGRSSETVDRVVSQLAEEGLVEVHGVVADLGTAEGCDSFFAAVAATGRPVHVLVNNMGVFGTKNFFDCTDDDWMSYFTTNVMSTVRHAVSESGLLSLPCKFFPDSWFPELSSTFLNPVLLLPLPGTLLPPLPQVHAGGERGPGHYCILRLVPGRLLRLQSD